MTILSKARKWEKESKRLFVFGWVTEYQPFPNQSPRKITERQGIVEQLRGCAAVNVGAQLHQTVWRGTAFKRRKTSQGLISILPTGHSVMVFNTKQEAMDWVQTVVLLEGEP